jgi:hypothetical protein
MKPGPRMCWTCFGSVAVTVSSSPFGSSVAFRRDVLKLTLDGDAAPVRASTEPRVLQQPIPEHEKNQTDQECRGFPSDPDSAPIFHRDLGRANATAGSASTSTLISVNRDQRAPTARRDEDGSWVSALMRPTL